MYCNELKVTKSNGSINMEIVINKETQSEKIIVPKYCTSITLQFSDVFDEPIINTNISVTNKVDNNITFNAVTNINGIIILNNILYGNYEIIIN